MVKEFIQFADTTSHIELTTLIVNGLNDSALEMEQLASWVSSIDDEIPLHVSRFFPVWKMSDTQATPVEKVMKPWSEPSFTTSETGGAAPSRKVIGASELLSSLFGLLTRPVQ